MKPTAIIYLLWDKNINVLDQYLYQDKCAVITLSGYCTKNLINTVNRHQVDLIKIDDFIDGSESAEFAKKTENLKTQCELYLKNQSINNENIDCLVLAISNSAYSSFQLIKCLDKISKKYSIKLIVVNEEYMQKARTVVLWGKGFNIPTLHLTHGANLVQLYTVHGHADADVTAVFGERLLDGFLDIGLPKHRLIVTGNPAWDCYKSLVAKRYSVRKEILYKYGINNGAPMVVFATTWCAGLTVTEDNSIPADLVGEIFRCYYNLTRKAKFVFNLVIKDRGQSQHVKTGYENILKIAEEAGLSVDDFIYETENTEALITASDVVIACDSNILIEAMMAGVPAVNLINLNGLRLGPPFHGDSGVIEIEPFKLTDVLQQLLDDEFYRESHVRYASEMVAMYNLGIDGCAAKRVADLMIEMKKTKQDTDALESPLLKIDASPDYVWKVLDKASSAVVNIGASYHNHIRHELVELFLHEPKIVLDVGCAAGVTGAEIKRIYPDARVVGVELNKASIDFARQRLDRVIEGSIEDIDLLNYGLSLHSIDTVILADVLEHMFNPWGVMVKLKEYLTEDAQVLASIPNSRNFWLLNHLANGFWRYESEGLLDVTHVRFFTWQEIQRFFLETGYEIVRNGRVWDGRLMKVLPNANGCLETDKLVIKNVDQAELEELRTLQFLVVARLSSLSSTKQKVDYFSDAISQNQNNTKNLYTSWSEKHALSVVDAEIIAERIEHKWAIRPIFNLVVEIAQGDEQRLADTIDSLSQQLYNRWRLIILAPFPAPDRSFDEIDVVSWYVVENSEMRYDIKQSLLSDDETDWFLVVRPGTQFEIHAFAYLGEYVNLFPEAHLIYTDDDVREGRGSFNPRFKPDFNLDYFYSCDYLGICAFSGQALKTLGGWCLDYQVQSYDFALRLLDRYGESAFAHISEVLFHLPVIILSEVYDQTIKAALSRHFEKRHIDVEIQNGYLPHTFNLIYNNQQTPLVSVIVPTRDRIDLLKPCIDGLLDKTSYSNYEILIVDNQSKEPETLSYFKQLEAENGHIRIIEYPKLYNYSAINNFAAQQAKGDYLLLLNNDTVIIQDQWLERMLNHGQREEVGIVGARLVFPNQTIQHAGVILGMGSFGVADHPHISLPMTEPGYMNRAQVVQNFSAVTAACMLIRKSVYFEAGGLDDENFKVLFNDVDLCLKVRELGYKIVWTPYATVIHHGSSSIKADKNPDKAKRAREEADKMVEKWLPQLANDPAYNRNLSLKHRHFQIETETDVTWNVDFHDRPRVYAFPANDSGVGEYRVRSPLRALTQASMIQSSLLPNHSATLIPDIVEIERVKPDVLFLQNGTADYLLHAWAQYRKFNDAFMIYSQDDLVFALPGKHPLQGKWPKDMRKRLRKLMEQSDRLIVATEPLKEEYSRWISDVKVVPNYLEKAKWLDLNIESRPRNGKKLRVGWAGGGQHHGDLEFILPVVEATKGEVDWIFMGMCPERIRPMVKEYHGGVVFDLYPQKLADLDLDLAIAPLEYNNFNMAKTNLRLLEYGVLGWPVLCSDITPYRNAPVTRVGNNVNQWIKALREKIHEPVALVQEGQVLKQWVLDNYLLEDHLYEWLAALMP